MRKLQFHHTLYTLHTSLYTYTVIICIYFVSNKEWVTYCCFQKQILDFPLSLFKLCFRNIQRLHYHVFLCILQTLFRNIATNYVSEIDVLLSATNRQSRAIWNGKKCSLVSGDMRASGLLQLVPAIVTVRALIILLQHWVIIILNQHSVKFMYLFYEY